MRLLVLLAAASLGVGAAGCGGAGKGAGGGAQASASSATTPAGTGGTSTGGANTNATSEGNTDNNIPAYGHEASAADRRAITALVKRYYAATAAADGSRGCALIYPPVERAIPEDYGQPPGPPYARGKTCAVVMSKIFKHITRHPADLAATEVTGVRLKGGFGFAELHNKMMPKGVIAVERKGASWKIEWLTARAMTPSGGAGP